MRIPSCNLQKTSHIASRAVHQLHLAHLPCTPCQRTSLQSQACYSSTDASTVLAAPPSRDAQAIERAQEPTTTAPRLSSKPPMKQSRPSSTSTSTSDPSVLAERLVQFAKLPFKQSAPVDQVVATCNILKKNVQGMSIRDAAIATWAAGKLGRRSKSESLVNASTNLVKVICQQLGERLHVSKATLQPVFTPLTPAELCMLVMGLSWLKLQPAPGLLDAIARDAVSRIGDFNAQGYSNLLWAMYSMRHDALDGALMRAIGDAMRAQANYSTYTSQAVANVLQVAAWDEGTPLPEDVLDGLAERALGAMEEFVPRTYPALMLTLAQLQYKPLNGRLQQTLMAAMGSNAQVIIDQLPARELANLIVALDTLTDGEDGDGDVAAVLAAAHEKLEMCSLESLYQFLTMCNVRQRNPFCHRDPCPVVAAAAAYTRQLPTTQRTVMQLCNVLCACSGVGQRLPTHVLDDLAAAMMVQMHQFAPQTYGRVAWGFAKQEYSPLKGEFFNIMYAALLDDATTLGLFGEQDMSQLMWASSYLEQPPPLELMDAIAHVALDKIDEFTATTAQSFQSTFDNLGYAPLDGKLARAVSIKIHTRSAAGRAA